MPLFASFSWLASLRRAGSEVIDVAPRIRSASSYHGPTSSTRTTASRRARRVRSPSLSRQTSGSSNANCKLLVYFCVPTHLKYLLLVFRLTLGGKLGEGCFGQVLKAYVKTESFIKDPVVAVKTMKGKRCVHLCVLYYDVSLHN